MSTTETCSCVCNPGYELSPSGECVKQPCGGCPANYSCVSIASGPGNCMPDADYQCPSPCPQNSTCQTTSGPPGTCEKLENFEYYSHENENDSTVCECQSSQPGPQPVPVPVPVPSGPGTSENEKLAIILGSVGGGLILLLIIGIIIFEVTKKHSKVNPQ